MDEANVNGADIAQNAAEAVKTITQEDLDRIVKREKFDEAERVRREMQALHAQELAKVKSGETVNTGGMREQSPLDTEKLKADMMAQFKADMQAERQKHEEAQQFEEAKKVAENWYGTVDRAKKKYEGFEEVFGDFDANQFPQLVHALSTVDNGEDVLNELAQNPAKLDKIINRLRYTPQAGLRDLKMMSDSIKQNMEAMQSFEPANEPLSQIKQSHVSFDSGMNLEKMKTDPRFMF